MDLQRESVRAWLFEALTSHLASVFEALAGARPSIRLEHVAGPVGFGGLSWRQGFQGVPGAVWVEAAQKDWTETGGQVLRAAGVEDGDEATVKSTFLEILGQALGGLAREMTARAGHEVTLAAGVESQSSAAEGAWARLHLQFPNAAAELAVGLELALLDSFGGETARTGEAVNGSKTFELLLDVELPVSVSFGRAQVPLKDVIKLTTGSIVELNRSIAEPVEVIVNNCVIARGEVVVVEGNFGVRIQEVISQKERLRTLN